MSLEHLADFIVRQVGDTWVIDANRVKVCLTCGALIPQGAHAVHVRWHEGDAIARAADFNARRTP